MRSDFSLNNNDICTRTNARINRYCRMLGTSVMNTGMRLTRRDTMFSFWSLSDEPNCYILKRKRCGMRTLLLCTADNVPRTVLRTKCGWKNGRDLRTYLVCSSCLKKNQSTPRPSEHPPVMGEKISKRLGGIKGCKYKTSSWHLNRFPDADNIGSTV